MVFADGFDHFACFWIVGNADPGIKDAQIVVDFGHGADSAAGIAGMGFLFDGDGGRKAFDVTDFGLGHLLDKLAGIRGKRFDIAPLPFGIDGFKGQRGFAGAGGPVQMVIFSRGMVTSRFFRLFCSAPVTVISWIAAYPCLSFGLRFLCWRSGHA